MNTSPRKYKLVTSEPFQSIRSFAYEKGMFAAYEAAKRAGHVMEMYEEIDGQYHRMYHPDELRSSV